MADIIDMATRRRGGNTAEPYGILTCTFDTAPGVVIVKFVTPEGDFEFGISPEGAEQLVTRLSLAAFGALREQAKENRDG